MGVQALLHPFLAAVTLDASMVPEAAVQRRRRRGRRWESLDGLQRLGWAAVARASAESELPREAVTAALKASQPAACAVAAKGRVVQVGPSEERETYLWALARELSETPAFVWPFDGAVFAEVLRLAFRYLDDDDDGILSAQDLFSHLAPPTPDTKSAADARSAVKAWIARWGNSRARAGIAPQGFRTAILTRGAHASPDDDDDDDDEGMPSASMGCARTRAGTSRACGCGVRAGFDGEDDDGIPEPHSAFGGHDFDSEDELVGFWGVLPVISTATASATTETMR
eukprot:NODE_1199_length_1213_cov_418.662349.p1 GENE.NODE_1199_length_1213_cov_418.662349~~NODE_1199_length_1213_cov_418.662349.p1  ORF type:complete len:285 (+),score=68.58 NODE_1199_length_1213_cov_418.662349:3-857(+)